MYGSDDDYRNIAWNITEYPTVTTDDLSIDSGNFYVYGGEAEVAYEYKDYDDSWEPTAGHHAGRRLIGMISHGTGHLLRAPCRKWKNP